jgi:tetratricopeptide (TPR) repeat protein
MAILKEDVQTSGAVQAELLLRGIRAADLAQWLESQAPGWLAHRQDYGELGERLRFLATITRGDLARVAGKIGQDLLITVELRQEIGGEDLESLYDQGWDLLNEGRYEEGLLFFGGILQNYPNFAKGWNGKGSALDYLGRYEEAIASLDKALQLKPDFYGAWNTRGNALFNLGRYEEADGYYYPLKLGDTYALRVDCSGKLANPEWEQLSTLDKLPDLRSIILNKTPYLPEMLGKSWLIYGQLTGDDSGIKDRAKTYYQSFYQDSKDQWERDFIGEGKYKNAYLFELKRTQNYHREHCLTYLFPPSLSEKVIIKDIKEFYLDLTYLLFYRHKIIWAYENSRKLKQALKNTAPTIEALINNISDALTVLPVNLKQLQNNLAAGLTIAHTYQTNLSYLQENQASIETNIENFHLRLETIKDQDRNAELGFWEEFYTLAKEKYIKQITRDIKSLSTSNKTLDNLIKTTQGIIEIENTKNQIGLNRTVALVSAGVGTAGVTATTFNKSLEIINFPKQDPIPTNYYWKSFALSLSLSIVLGVIAASLTYWFLKWGKLPKK